MNKTNRERIDSLRNEHAALSEDLKILLGTLDENEEAALFKAAFDTCTENYGDDVYIRGLIEFSNYCKNGCFYCGIRNGNKNADRYRLSEQEILDCADAGYELGFRTFVLQGGEDPYFTDEIMVPIVKKLKEAHGDCAVTLSLGERSRESYQKLFDAGADRYLLRHETITPGHYRMLHPDNMSLENRLRCLENLREIGYQVGCGIMVGSPGQTTDDLVADLQFMKRFRPHMVGIGPFIPHADTPFANEKPGSVETTLRLLALLRLLMPAVLLPATTALGTADPLGREKGIRAGANVIMPNLSPVTVRNKYMLYDGKICTGEEAAECIRCTERRIAYAGRRMVIGRGDSHVK